MLDGTHALLDRQAHILGANVVLEIDERLHATVCVKGRRVDIRGAQRQKIVLDSVDPSARRGEAGRCRRSSSRRVAFRERAGKIKRRVAGAGRPLALRRCARLEELLRFVEGKLATRLREEVYRGCPPARHQQRIAGDFSISAGMLDPNRVDPQATVDANELGTGDDLDARGPRGLRQRSLGFWAQIGDQRDPNARFLEVECGAVGAIVRGRDDDAVADLGAILTAIAPPGIGQHNCWAVIVRKDERTLDRAGRQHHLTRAHLPQTLARQVGIGDEVVFGDALVKRDEILRVIAERLRARHQPHIGRGPQRGDRVLEPRERTLDIDLRLCLGEERAA